MTDRRRVTHPAAPGLSDAGALPDRPHVVVVGAGIAGLAAATGLAERGVTVDVVERCGYLGGRVGGWTEALPNGERVAMNRGFHAFFRQYYNLRSLLGRVDRELAMLRPVNDYPLIDAAGRLDTFEGLPHTPPLNALAFALRSPTFRLRDLIRLNARAAAPLAAVSVPDIYGRLDHVDAESFLRDINFPEAARHLAFEVFSRSFFAEPAELSAAELATMFHIYFLGSSEGLVFDVADANFDVALWNPLAGHLESHRCAVSHRRVGDRGARRRAADGALRYRGRNCGRWRRAGDRRRGLAADRRELAGHRGPRLAPTRGVAAHRRPVRGAPPLAGPQGQPGSGRVPGHRRTAAVGQCQRAGTLRA